MQRQTTALAEQFARDGFLIVPDLFTREETRVWKEECQRILVALTEEVQARGEERPRFWRTGVYVGLSIRSEVFRRLNRDPRLLDCLEPIVGSNIMFWSDKVVFKGEQADFGTPWHQDWAYWKGCHKISVWIALDDADPSNGCLKLLPGSHRWFTIHDGKVRPEEGFTHRVDPEHLDESRAVTAVAPAGSAVIFHDLTLHASHPNTTRRDRWAVISTFKDPLAEDLEYPTMTAAAVVRGGGRATTSAT